MKIKYFAISLLIFTLNIQAILFESDNLSDIHNHTDKNTLVVFDIDDTIMTPKIWPGSSVWLEYEIGRMQKIGFKFEDALYLILPLYFSVHQFTEDMMTPLDNSPHLIKTLQKNNIKAMALTNRSMPMYEITLRELGFIGIDFTINSLYDQDLPLSITHKAKFSNGIIFCGNNDKGELLFQFLEKIDFVPKKIIFIDDKLKNVTSVQKAVEKRGIEFVGIRFTQIDEIRKTFDPNEAKNQLATFKRNVGISPLE